MRLRKPCRKRDLSGGDLGAFSTGAKEMLRRTKKPMRAEGLDQPANMYTGKTLNKA